MDSTAGRLVWYGVEEQGRSSWTAALFTSSAIYVMIAVAVVVIGSAAKKVISEKPVDITFVEKVAKEIPPPPPPPPAAAPPVAPPPAPPVVPKESQLRKLD